MGRRWLWGVVVGGGLLLAACGTDSFVLEDAGVPGADGALPDGSFDGTTPDAPGLDAGDDQTLGDDQSTGDDQTTGDAPDAPASEDAPAAEDAPAEATSDAAESGTGDSGEEDAGHADAADGDTTHDAAVDATTDASPDASEKDAGEPDAAADAFADAPAEASVDAAPDASTCAVAGLWSMTVQTVTAVPPLCQGVMDCTNCNIFFNATATQPTATTIDWSVDPGGTICTAFTGNVTPGGTFTSSETNCSPAGNGTTFDGQIDVATCSMTGTYIYKLTGCTITYTITGTQ